MTSIEKAAEPAADQWRDKKRHLWLVGLVAPTALFVVLPLVRFMNQHGWHTASQSLLWIGPLAAIAGPAFVYVRLNSLFSSFSGVPSCGVTLEISSK